MTTDKEFIDSLKRDWTSSDYYNYTDLNRVENSTIAVKNMIASFRDIIVALGPVTTNRTQSTIEFADSLNRIESNITLLKNSFPDPSMFQDSKTWTYNMPFDFSDANRFEQSLYDMYSYLELNASTIPYCGQYTAGQEGVL